jgi:menaquinone-specific isochorismate synthase
VTAVQSRATAEVRTVEIEPPAERLMDLLPEHGGLAWVSGGTGLIGWGITSRFEMRGTDRFERADAWWRARAASMDVADEVGLPGCGPVAFGSFAFDGDRATSVLVVPKVVVGVRDGRWWLTTISGSGGPPSDPLPRAWSLPRSPGSVRESGGALSPAAWSAAVASAVDRIGAGEVGKVVLARDVVVRADERLDPRWPLRRLAEAYPSCWTFSIDGLIGATPELLVRLDGGQAFSRVLAGTQPRVPGEEAARSAALASSAKDLAEHAYGVASVLDALAPHCGPVTADGPYVLELPNVLHLATDVTAGVTDGSTSLGLLGSLHPSAAVCGTPRPSAMQVIRAVEGMDRGRYAGPVGWVGAAGDGEWGIALRCAQIDPVEPDTLRLLAGCGIVAGSDPDSELAESEAKLVPMREALSPA